MKRGLDGPAPEERPSPAGRRNKQGIRIDPEVEATYEPRRTVISALVEHEPGVLSDVSGLFSRRQFNIESLTVGPTENDDHARITIVVEEPDPGIDQVEKQLRKLVPVISVRELEPDAMRRELELVLIKVGAGATRPGRRCCGHVQRQDGRLESETATIEVTGARQKIEAAIDTFSQFGIREISRTGTTALARGIDRTAASDSTGQPADEANYDGQYTETATND